MRFLIAFAFSLLSISSFGQEEGYSLQAKKSGNDEIVLDGVLSENAWQNAQKINSFVQQYPYDTAFSQTQTEVFVTYDDLALYVAAICYDNNPEKPFVIQSLKRDFSYPRSDAFAIFLDPFEDKTNGFSFAVNPMGAQREGTLENGGTFGVSTAWDTKWFSKVKRESGKWIVEMKIPFKSIRFRENRTTWGINFSRNNLKINENSCWVPVPRNFNIATLGFTGKLHFEDAPKKPKANVAIIPYVAGTNFVNNEVSPNKTEFDPKVGLDAKVAVTSSLNLDLTINSDFSQVEVDDQQINLTRFSLFFPEKRLFFIENGDLFANFGFRQIRPFFSRKIGLSRGQQIPILGGARLSGKMGKDWRVGLMNMQTEKKENLADAQNYTVAAVQRQVFKTSNIAAIAVNRQTTDGGTIAPDFNRVLGLDYNMYELDNRLRGKFFYHQAFTPEKKKEQYSHASWVMYEDKHWFGMWNHEYVGKNYNAEVGFVPRTTFVDEVKQEIHKLSYWRLEPGFAHTFFPKKSKHLLGIKPGIYHSSYYDSSFTLMESEITPYVDFEMRNSAEFSVKFKHEFANFYFPNYITGDTSHPVQFGKYNFVNVEMAFNSNKRKTFYYELLAGTGEFYSAIRTKYGATANYRFQPYGTFALTGRYDIIEFNANQKADILLLGAKAELSFSKSVFFSTFVQYNTQRENMNLYSRFQWRFKPMSDFFIVYSENYDNVLNNKNRTLSFKLLYWLTP